MTPRVLVACEFSGIVREAFREQGWNAWSADLLPTEIPGQHWQGDVLEIIRDPGWDLVVAHPPCTYLANSGVRWLYRGGRGTMPEPDRWVAMREAADFFRAMLDAPAPMVAVENPVQHRHAGLPKPTQIVQPWWFGDPETKATGLWLRGLPRLVPTGIVDGREPRVHYASPGPNRWKERSRTPRGLARAMAEQWSNR